ncbi:MULTISPECIES: winged helix-turn-helix transcriptional regulator [Ralstonia solanacearum species complex]|uniref:Transcriptional regulator n=1 Tax=Ralstonia solanacearum K60 TaxID=1091042 RepID=A0AAP7ZHS6_RALSL|nr:helix-turn-helix domain-containing protein [Ralstonia solanacearum]OYQ09337.1 transcriptional regulator [Ralstonia solanacearum K60]QOK84212.1 helix-turn-helix transcriptional regulator [Ralstonia solanacearum]RIJ84707.1 transcriptional regulator [Ralstonia solanacearum]
MSPSHIDLSRLPKPSESDCRTTREILDLVGDKWTLYVVGPLSGGSRRFNELKREIEGISQRMLTLAPRGLEHDGLVTRTVFPSIPPRVDYALTELGRTLLEPVTALIAWADDNKPAIAQTRRRFDEKPDPALVPFQGVIHQRR